MTPPPLVNELRPSSAAVAGLTVSAADDQAAGLRACLADASKLVRPRIAVMVLATVFAAAWLTAGRPEATGRLLWLLAGTALVAASSSIANQVLERRLDRLMTRTADRPLAAGRLSVRTGWLLAGLTLAAGEAICWWAAGWQPAAAAAATWLLYVAAYTPLKTVTPLNTAVGAVAGALPVAIGWLAADGPARLAAGDARGALAVAALATVLYLWQFPHFMAIAWLYRAHYAAAGMRMLTVVDPSGLRAAGQALAASLALLPAALVLAVPSGSIRMFLSAAVAGSVYLLATIRFAVRRDDAAARVLLLSSLGSLLGLLTAAVVFGGPS